MADMIPDWAKVTTAIAVAIGLGAAIRLGLEGLLGGEAVALAAVNILGWFVLGLVSGRIGSRIRYLRVFLLALGATANTSWLSLIIRRGTMAGDVIIAFFEVAIGLMFAGVGHLATMRRGPDLRT